MYEKTFTVTTRARNQEKEIMNQKRKQEEINWKSKMDAEMLSDGEENKVRET